MTPAQQAAIANARARRMATEQAKPQPNMLGRGLAAAEAYSQGMFTPFVDEVIDYGIAAPIASTITGAPYEQTSRMARAETEARQKQNKELYPVTDIVAGLTGGVAGLGMLGGTGVGKGIDALSRPIAQKGLAKISEAGLRGGVIGGSTGAATGYGQGFDSEDRAAKAGEGALLGGVLGGGLGVLGATGSELKRTFTPEYDPFTADLAKKAQAIGIKVPVDAGQDAPNLKKAIRAAETIPFAGTGKIERENLKNWSQAVGRTIGVDEPISAPTLAKAYDQIGSRFDKIETGRTVEVTQDFLNGLDELDNFAQTAVTKDIGEQLQGQLSKIRENIAGKKEVPVETFARLRKDFRKMGDKASNYELSSAYKEAEGFLGDTIIDSLPGATKSDYSDLKKTYRNFLSVTKAVKLDPVGALESPSKFLSSVATVYKDFPRGGGGEVADLARIGKLFIKSRPEGSPTAANLMGVLGPVGTGAAALGSGAGALPALGAAGGVIGGANLITRNAYNQDLVDEAIKRASGILPAQPSGLLGSTTKTLGGGNPLRIIVPVPIRPNKGK